MFKINFFSFLFKKITKTKKKATIELMKKYERLEHVAVDKYGNRFWRFSFIRGIVLEVKTEDECKSK